MAKQAGFPMFIVDAFTGSPFSGNPAAVCLNTSAHELSEESMQKIAAEMNLSETAFIQRLHNTDTFGSSERFGLRWFTPAVEVPLCGHATLASAAVIFHCLDNKAERLTFETLSGPLVAVRDGDFISMDLPLNDPQPVQKSELEELSGIVKVLVGELKVQDVQYSPTTRKLLVRLDDSLTISDLQRLRPAIGQLTSLHNSGQVRGVIVTVRGDAAAADGDKYDFGSRFFGPWVGINEDPVTARQCSARGGNLRLDVRRDEGRIDVAGRSVVVLRGTLAIATE